VDRAVAPSRVDADVREKAAPGRSQRTTRDSYKPATECGRRFRFEPTEQEPNPGRAI
jgi:hypothetical protein